MVVYERPEVFRGWQQASSNYSSGPRTFHHFGFRRACLTLRVFFPRAPLMACSSLNFFFAYRLASASSTSSSTSVRLRWLRGRLSPDEFPKGDPVVAILPIWRQGVGVYIRRCSEDRTYCKVFRQSFGSFSFPFVFPVEPLGVKLIAQAHRFVFTM